MCNNFKIKRQFVIVNQIQVKLTFEILNMTNNRVKDFPKYARKM